MTSSTVCPRSIISFFSTASIFDTLLTALSVQDYLDDLAEGSKNNLVPPNLRPCLLNLVRSVLSSHARRLISGPGETVDLRTLAQPAGLAALEPVLVAGQATHYLANLLSGQRGPLTYYPVAEDRYVRFQHQLIIVETLSYQFLKSVGEPKSHRQAEEYRRLSFCAGQILVDLVAEYRSEGREGKKVADAMLQTLKTTWTWNTLGELLPQ
jgi:hypothetical protein